MTYSQLRAQLIEHYIKPAGIIDSRILRAFRNVPRHKFVPIEYQSQAYDDCPLPIGEGQTISQPSLVALMTDYLALTGHETVLEIGTGSGYQAAILSRLSKIVYSIERIPSLAQRARRILRSLGYANVKVIVGNGIRGLPRYAPFDRIIVTAGAKKIPQPLIDQLTEDGSMVLPLAESGSWQRMVVLHKKISVRFVPLV